MAKDGSDEGVPVPFPEWPSLRFDYLQKFGQWNRVVSRQ